MARIHIAAGAIAAGAALAASAGPSPAAEPVMVQCGREYQAAKAAGTLNGADWNAYRTACADRLKAAPAAAPAPAPAAAAAPVAPSVPAARAEAPVAAPIAAPVAPPAAVVASPAASPPAAAPPASAGTAAMHARQKQCGAEWTAGKAALVAATPGLTWPRYWSQCNARIKSTGR